jgi:hypothetical protein
VSWGVLAGLAAMAVAFWTSYAVVRPTNFGGTDEWLLIELSSRGVLGVPYANRPLVLLWTVLAARAWPHDLRAFWLFNGLYLFGAAALTMALVRRLWPGGAALALLAGVFAAVWAPRDAARLSGLLSCGYAGFTLCTMAAVVLFVEWWFRRRLDLLALGAVLGFVASRGVESVTFVLLAAPLLVLDDASRHWRRLLRWLIVWYGVVALELGLAVWPLLSGAPSYQSGALGFDPHPVRVVMRLVWLLGMQAGPLVSSAPGELLTAAVPLAAGGFVVLAAVAMRWDDARLAGEAFHRGPALRALGLGLLLAVSAHAGLALSASVKTPARTQILSGPGFGLALASVVVLLGSLLPRRMRWAGTLVLAAWVVAVGAGRTVAMQGEWDRFRSVFPEQHRTLSGLVREAPGLKPGTLVLLLNGGSAWPMSFTFRHAVAYLYPGQALGLVPGGNDMLYPWRFTPDGVAIEPWPAIREPWGVSPTFHPWDALVVVGRTGSGRLEVLSRWPEDALLPLPAGARYAPRERIVRGEPPPASRRILDTGSAGGAD